MLQVSASFDTVMSQNTRDKIYAEVEYRQAPVGASEGSTISAAGQNAVSIPADLKSDAIMNDYATLESNRWLLDGTKKIMPDTGRQAVGIWSGTLSSADKSLSTALEITAVLSSVISSAGLSIWFDEAQGGYSPNFTIKVFNGSTLLNTINATAISNLYVYKGALTGYNKVVITIPSWNIPGQYARVSRLVFGLVYIDTDINTVEFSVLRQIDPVNSNNQASELRWSRSNLDGGFSYGNPGGTFDFIAQRQEAIPRIGFKSEKLPLGRYFLSSWTIDDYKGQFQALDALSLTDVSFPDNTYPSGTTLMSIAQAALSTSRISKYSLDSSLSGITLATATAISGKTCRNILAWIATAACLTLYCDVYGITTIGALPGNSTGYLLSWLNGQKPTLKLDDPVKKITVGYGDNLAVSHSYIDTGREYSVTDNPFITTASQATAVLNWLYAYYSRRANYTSNWRQNPKIEPGDIIAVQGKYSSPNAQVLSQQYTYSGGGLTGQTVSKAV